MSNTDPIDRTALTNLLAMFNDDASFLQQVIETYLADAVNLLATLQQAVANSQADDLRRAAHSLKSNSANLGATTLTALSRELEEMGRLGNLIGTQDKLAALEAEFVRVKESLLKIKTAGV